MRTKKQTSKLFRSALRYDWDTDTLTKKQHEAQALGYTSEGALSYCRKERKAKKRALAKYMHLVSWRKPTDIEV